MDRTLRLLPVLLTAVFWLGERPLVAQEPVVPNPMPVPAMPSARAQRPHAASAGQAAAAENPDPAELPAQTFVDSRDHLSFHLPAGWILSRKDGEISTFHLDARSAPATARLRAAANLGFNPFPLSTFAGAIFYLSVTPHSSAAACAAQTTVKPQKALPPMTVANLRFNRGLDEHGHICTEARVLTYTALHDRSCVRFDLAVNTFCGGEDSGAKDMTDAELASVFRRMEGILDTVRFSDVRDAPRTP
jgi:hypothetical protein